MLFPIRCWTCNHPIGHLYNQYTVDTNALGIHRKTCLDNMNVHRYCCRRMFLTHPQMLADEVASFRDVYVPPSTHSAVTFPTERTPKRLYDIDKMYSEANEIEGTDNPS